MVDSDYIASSGFDLHSVADGLVLVLCAAEGDAWSAFRFGLVALCLI